MKWIDKIREKRKIRKDGKKIKTLSKKATVYAKIYQTMNKAAL